MNFKTYDILSSLIPGFLIMLASMSLLEIKFDKDLVVAYTAIAFPLGYIINSISSWLEDFYFWSWGGKPSVKLLNGNGIWKVRFYNSIKVKSQLIKDCDNLQASNEELFEFACRYATGEKDSKVEDLNASYVFSRNMLTTVLLSTPILLVEHYNDWRYYATLLPMLFVVWLRCKQRGYFFTRQVFNNYLKNKKL